MTYGASPFRDANDQTFLRLRPKLGGAKGRFRHFERAKLLRLFADTLGKIATLPLLTGYPRAVVVSEIGQRQAGDAKVFSKIGRRWTGAGIRPGRNDTTGPFVSRP